jgi:hypothetical protein
LQCKFNTGIVGTLQAEGGYVLLKKDRGAKTQTLSLRLDPKTKFSLEFVARINGQTLTTVVERAIRSACDQVTILRYGIKENWQTFWDPDEGIRTLQLLACESYPSNYDEDDLREFTKAHWEFFYIQPEGRGPRGEFVVVLWSKIEDYRRIWHEQRERDYWAAGRAMAADLSAAQLEPPRWPRENGQDYTPF